MRKRTIGVILVAGVGAGLVACAAERPVRPVTTMQTRHAEEGFDARLRQIAREYTNWTRVSDLAQWAPALCRAPQTKGGIRMSDTEDFTAHGRKLYYLFAQDTRAYTRLAWQDDDGVVTSPAGQAVVKESWFAEPMHGAAVPFAGYGIDRRNTDTAHGADGREYRAGAKGDLFIMFKLDPMTPGTDDGWVYGTTTPDGSKVTSLGRVQSCMNCHTQAPHDRLFGPK